MNRIKLFRLGVRVMLGSIAIAQAQQTATIAGAAYSAPIPIAIAPGALTTIYVQGIGNAINAPVFASGLPLPVKLSGISVSPGIFRGQS